MVKDIKQTSIFFPVMLVFMVGIRKALDCVFTKDELRILDDIFPSFKRIKHMDAEEQQDKVRNTCWDAHIPTNYYSCPL